MDGVLQAYVDGLRGTFWITAACAIAAFFCCLGLQWKSVKVGHGQEKETGDVEAEKDGKAGSLKSGRIEEVEGKKDEGAVEEKA